MVRVKPYDRAIPECPCAGGTAASAITQTLGHVGEPFEAVIDGPERDCPVIRLCGASQSHQCNLRKILARVTEWFCLELSRQLLKL